MKKSIALLVLFYLALAGWSQDTIYFHDGQKIPAIVEQLGINKVKYKKYSNPNGPFYFIEKARINKIVYPNGSTDYFIYDPEEISFVEDTEEIEVDWNRYKYKGVIFSAKGIRKLLIDKEQRELLEESNRIRNLHHAAHYASIGALGLGGVFGYIGVYFFNGSATPYFIASGWSALTAGVLFIEGEVLKTVYKNRIRKAVSKYNQKLNKKNEAN